MRRIKSADAQMQENRTIIRGLQEELSATSTRELVALSRSEDAFERIKTIEIDLDKAKTALVAKDEMSVPLFQPIFWADELVSEGCIKPTLVLRFPRFHFRCHISRHRIFSLKQVLQERFEDQSITLRITKDLSAELQVTSVIFHLY
jgi:hypothetical protein